jgi:hypothetical protein
MTIVPLQYFGIGDVIFTQTLVSTIAQGDKILWPVLPHFVEGLNRAYPDITFMDYRHVNVNYNCKSDIEIGETRLLPIRWADSLMKVPYDQCMRAKYDLYGLDWQQWKNKAAWQNDVKRQMELVQHLGLDLTEPFCLVNNTFGSESRHKVSIMQKSGIKHVVMSTIEGFSLFDWTGIMQYATEIHTVSSSIIYLLEMMELKAKEIHIYKREPIEKNHDNYSYILQKHNYNLK